MYELRVEGEFSSSHQLREYEGKCENLHGHNWRVEMFVQGETLNRIGLLVDFKILRTVLKDILETLDHQFINDIAPFNEINPSAENIAKYLYDEAKEKLADYPVKVSRINVYETNKSLASYFEG